MPQERRANRGPGAAAANREALISAAREIFAESGFDAPLSRIARRAGVGQGSLYRHFSDRGALAMAVFEDNVTGLEDYAARPGVGLEQVLETIREQLVTSMAFVELLDPPVSDPCLAQLGERVGALLSGQLDSARRRGVVRADLTGAELMLGLSMLAAVLSRTPTGARAEVAERGWLLLRRGLDG